MSTDYPLTSTREGNSTGVVLGIFAVIVAFGISYWIATNDPSSEKAPAPSPSVSAPILAQANIMKYPSVGRYDSAWIEIEGKIYNPNSVPVRNVSVQWKIYSNETDKEVWERERFETTCSFDFAFIPPKTTYDFKTNKIKFRDADVMDSMGRKPVDAPMNLRPEIKFVSDP